MLRGTRELARRLPLASGSYPPRAWSLGAAGVGRAGTDGDSLRESTWRLSMCRQRRDASTSWREDTRPCYGGDARNHVGLEFKLTADDAQRALRKWAKCVPNTQPGRSPPGCPQISHHSHRPDSRRTPRAHIPCLPSPQTQRETLSAVVARGRRPARAHAPTRLPPLLGLRRDGLRQVPRQSRIRRGGEEGVGRGGHVARRGYHDVRRECTGDAGVRELRAQAGPRGGRHRAARGQVTLARRDQR